MGEEKKYTEEEMHDIAENAFNAAKDRYWGKGNQTGVTELFDGDKIPYHPEKYKTYQSYLLSKLKIKSKT